MPPSLPSVEQHDLQEHREILLKVGRMIEGDRPIRQTETSVLIYRIPDVQLMQALPETREKSFGTISWNEHGFFVQETGQEIHSPGDAHQKIDFLTGLRHTVEQRRRELAMEANETHDRSAATPGGQIGHVLKEYDQLLGQIEHEHYRQRDQRTSE